ncbi:MAG: site-specific integrase [Actinomycetota bacterium]|nr:site-specific integrase [Actinomycetota bacterium]
MSRREATKAHAQLLVDVEHGRTGPSRSLTVNQLAGHWWDAAARDLSPSTRIGYRGWLDSRVLPEFGKKRISSVTTADVERWYGKLRDGDKPLSVRSVRGCRTVLSAMFTAAVRWGYLPMSPVERARLPKGPKWNPRSPEPEHVAARIAAAEARDPDLGVFFRMAVAVGARRGELAGLRWSAFDFEQGSARLDTAIVRGDEDQSGRRTGARLVAKDTKTHAARVVAFDLGTAKALREMRRRHVEAALACGVPYPADAYVWRENVEGTRPVPPDRFSYAWRKIDKAVDDGAHVRLHDLRHFHGTMLVGAGVPLPSVRDRLGHSSLTVTNIYVDGRPEWDRKSADIMGDVLDGPL